MADPASPAISIPVAYVEELARATSIEAVLETAARWIPSTRDADWVRVTIIDDDRLIARTHGRDGCHTIADDLAPILEGSPRERVLRGGGAPLQLDAAGIAREPSLQQLTDLGMKVALFVPVQCAGRTIGLFELCRRSGIQFGWALVREILAGAAWVGGQAKLMQQMRVIARMAATDPLTGLANRARLLRVLDGPAALHLPDSQGRVVGVLHIDLDHFKEVNDRMGHATGDAVLKRAAATMQATAAPTDLVARIGGDEFVIVTRTDPGGRLLAGLAERVSDRLATPLRLGGTELRCPASIGTALAGPRDQTADRLIGNADIALYEVKRQGRGRVTAFTEEMRARYEARRQLVADLHQAVDQDAFEPLFQPIVSLDTGALTGIELLAYWPHPQQGRLGPADFLDHAADAGLVARIDSIIRARGLTALQRLRRDGWHVPLLSLNASAETLADPDLAEILEWEVLEKGLEPRDIAVEIDEAHLIADSAGAVARNIGRLARAGFAIEIDDFGAGHASMPHMRLLQITGLKLGPSLSAQLPDGCMETILRAILAMGAELRLSVTAKGVETPAAYTRLSALGCHRAQGFAIAEPLDYDGLVAFLDRQGNHRAQVAG